jgi:methyl-accepting chemotaxis protein
VVGGRVALRDAGGFIVAGPPPNPKLASEDVPIGGGLRYSAQVDVAEVQEALRVTIRKLLVLTLAVLCIASLGAIYLARRFSAPVKRVTSAASALAGDLAAVSRQLGGVQSPGTADAETKDEFELLMSALRTMRKAMASAIRSIELNSDALATSSADLTDQSRRLASTAEETSRQADGAAGAASQVSNGVRSVSDGMEQMRTSFLEISQNTGDTARMATEAVEVAKNTNSAFRRLEQGSAAIGDVMKAITTIAGQTNLLALNATIEAARAGASGKGFAVVAAEVKELARKTASSSDEVRSRIEAIQADIRASLDATARLDDIIRRIHEHQRSVTSAVERQSLAAHEMSTSLVQAAQASTEIAGNVAGVAQAAQDTSRVAVETDRAAATLDGMAKSFKRLLADPSH